MEDYFGSGNRVVYLSLRIKNMADVQRRLEVLSMVDDGLVVFFKGRYSDLRDVLDQLGELKDDTSPDVIRRDDGDPKVCAVVRYYGGLGDMISMYPSVMKLSELYEKVYVLVPEEYHFLFEGGRFVCLPHDFHSSKKLRSNIGMFRERHREVSHECGVVYDAFCPAMRYEISSGHRPEKSRAEVFSSYFDVEYGPPRINYGKRHPAIPPSPVVGINLFSNHKSKDWPLSRIREVCAMFKSNGVTAVTFDTDAAIPEAISVVDMSVKEFCTAVASVDCMVTTDTGSLHVAGSAGVPVVGLFGPTNGEVTMRAYQSYKVIQILGQDDCFRPCHFGGSNRFRCQNRIGDCMKDITVSQVFNAAMSFVQ